MPEHRMQLEIDGQAFTTLADVLPESGPLKVLIVGKTPAPRSVDKGHYFQGTQGQMLWGKLRHYGLLYVPPGIYEDDVLLLHGYGITDIVKCPRLTGNEPSQDEYAEGGRRVLNLVSGLKPRVVLFAYLRALRKMLGLPVNYGFNPGLESAVGASVFACPLPGVGGQTACQIDFHWRKLREHLLENQICEVGTQCP